MNNQVIAYDKVTGKVKLIDGAVTIPLYKAKKKGFTPINLMHLAYQLIDDSSNPHDKKTAELLKQAVQEQRNKE